MLSTVSLLSADKRWVLRKSELHSINIDMWWVEERMKRGADICLCCFFCSITPLLIFFLRLVGPGQHWHLPQKPPSACSQLSPHGLLRATWSWDVPIKAKTQENVLFSWNTGEGTQRGPEFCTSFWNHKAWGHMPEELSLDFSPRIHW